MHNGASCWRSCRSVACGQVIWSPKLPGSVRDQVPCATDCWSCVVLQCTGWAWLCFIGCLKLNMFTLCLLQRIWRSLRNFRSMIPFIHSIIVLRVTKGPTRWYARGAGGFWKKKGSAKSDQNNSLFSKLQEIKSLFTKLAEKWGYMGGGGSACSLAWEEKDKTQKVCFQSGAKKKFAQGENPQPSPTYHLVHL